MVGTASAGAAGMVVRTSAAGLAARDSDLDVAVEVFASESLAVKPELLVESAD